MPGQYADILLGETKLGKFGKVSNQILSSFDISETSTLLFELDLNKIYSKHTKKSEDEIKKALERDRFLTATEAKDFGLIDEVVEKRI